MHVPRSTRRRVRGRRVRGRCVRVLWAWLLPGRQRRSGHRPLVARLPFWLPQGPGIVPHVILRVALFPS